MELNQKLFSKKNPKTFVHQTTGIYTPYQPHKINKKMGKYIKFNQNRSTTQMILCGWTGSATEPEAYRFKYVC